MTRVASSPATEVAPGEASGETPGGPRPRGALGFGLGHCLVLAWCASPLVSLPLVEYRVTHARSGGGGWEVLALLAFILLLVFVPVAASVGAFMLLRRTPRREGAGFLLLALVGAASLIGGWSARASVRRNMIARVMERAEPLIAAIRAHERTEGAAPHRLDVLIPDYLPALPSTGMRSDFKYRWNEARDSGDLHGARWALSVSMPGLNPLSFDSLIYLAHGIYPQDGFGGRLERMGEWAYVHE